MSVIIFGSIFKSRTLTNFAEYELYCSIQPVMKARNSVILRQWLWLPISKNRSERHEQIDGGVLFELSLQIYRRWLFSFHSVWRQMATVEPRYIYRFYCYDIHLSIWNCVGSDSKCLDLAALRAVGTIHGIVMNFEMSSIYMMMKFIHYLASCALPWWMMIC